MHSTDSRRAPVGFTRPWQCVRRFAAIVIIATAGCSSEPPIDASESRATAASELTSPPASTENIPITSTDRQTSVEPITGKSDSVTVPTMDVNAFMQAASEGNADAIASGLRQGIDVNAVDESQRTALQLASFDGHTDAVKVLLQSGSNVDQLDASGRTALMYAATGANDETVKALLAADADVHLADKVEQFTPLMFAAAEGQTDVVRLLLDAGADPSKQDLDGETALDFARENRHADVIKLLSK